MTGYNYTLLCVEAKTRYVENLKACGLPACPYHTLAHYWVNDHIQWPQLEWPEVHDYLINTLGVYTREAMKNCNDFEMHRQFASGWVQTVLFYQESCNSTLKADVIPSRRLNEKAYCLGAVSKQDESVLAAHCTCMAG